MLSHNVLIIYNSSDTKIVTTTNTYFTNNYKIKKITNGQTFSVVFIAKHISTTGLAVGGDVRMSPLVGGCSGQISPLFDSIQS